MKQTTLFLSSLIALLSTIAGAEKPTQAKLYNKLNWFAMLSAGPVWTDAGQTQTICLTPQVETAYVAKRNTNGLVAGELFLGVEQRASSSLKSRIGIQLVTTGDANFQGNIWDDGSELFNNYTYEYRVYHSSVSAKGMILLEKGYPIIPWFNASLGMGFNRAHGFDNQPLIFEALPNANFTNNTTNTTFTYTLGVGVQKTLAKHWQMGVGYEFSDWGKSELGHATGQTINSGIIVNHIYTNGFLINLTYMT